MSSDEDLERAREEVRRARQEADRLRHEARELERRLRSEARDQARAQRSEARAAMRIEREARRQPPGPGWTPPGVPGGPPPGFGPELSDGARSEQSFSLEGVTHVQIEHTAGRLTVRPCRDDETPGVVSTGSKSPPRIEVHRDGEHLKIEVQLSVGWLFKRKQGATTLIRLQAQFDELRVEQGYGEIHVRDIAARRIKLEVGAGTTSCVNTQGAVSANVGAGKLSILNHRGLANCDTGTGDVTVDIAELAAGEYQVHAGIGRAELRLPPGGEVHIRASSGMGKTRIEYPNGPATAATQVRMNTGVGEVSVRARAADAEAAPPLAATAKPQRGPQQRGPRRLEAEELRVLQMLEQGRISSQEAADLIAALHGAATPPDEEPSAGEAPVTDAPEPPQAPPSDTPDMQPQP